MDKLEREQKEEKSGESPTFEDLVYATAKFVKRSNRKE